LELPEAACLAGTRPSAATTGRAPRATARWAARELSARRCPGHPPERSIGHGSRNATDKVPAGRTFRGNNR
jgi:hypothetical protein